MENLSKVQKIVIYSIGIIIIILLVLYLYTKDNEKIYNYDNLIVENDVINNEVDKNIVKNYIFVHIVGEVEAPSVVKLEEGSRIVDAIEKVGGLTDSAEIENLNLAYKLKDGDKIYIPSLDDVIKYKEEGKIINYVTNGVESNFTVENNIEKNENNMDEEFFKSDGLVNINTATQTELEILEGIGPSTSKKIIDYREENGKFEKIEDIKNVTGIGDSKFNAIKDSICVN